MTSLLAWWNGPQEPAQHDPADVLTWSTGDMRYALQSGDVQIIREKWNDADEAKFVCSSLPSSSRHDGKLAEDKGLRCCAENTLGPLKGGLVLFCGALIDTHVERHLAVHLGVRTLLHAACYCSPSSLQVLRLPLCKVITFYENADCKSRAAVVTAGLRSTGGFTTRWLPLSSRESAASRSQQQQPLDEGMRIEIVTCAVLVLLRVLLADDAVDASMLDVLRVVSSSLDQIWQLPTACCHRSPQIWQQIVLQAQQSMVRWICSSVAFVAAVSAGDSDGSVVDKRDAEALELAVKMWLRCLRALGPNIPPVMIPAVTTLCMSVLEGDPSHAASTWCAKEQALMFFRSAFAEPDGFISPTDAVASTLRGVVGQWVRERPFFTCSLLALQLASLMVDSHNSSVRSLEPLMELVDLVLAFNKANRSSDGGPSSFAQHLEVCRNAAQVVRSWAALAQRRPSADHAAAASIDSLLLHWVRSTATSSLELLLELPSSGPTFAALDSSLSLSRSVASPLEEEDLLRSKWGTTLDALIAACPPQLFIVGACEAEIHHHPVAGRLLGSLSSSMVLTPFGEQWVNQMEACSLASAEMCGDILLRLHRPPFWNDRMRSGESSMNLWPRTFLHLDKLLLSLARFARQGVVTRCGTDRAVSRAILVLSDLASSKHGGATVPDACKRSLVLFALDELLLPEMSGCYDVCAIRLLALTDTPHRAAPAADQSGSSVEAELIALESLTTGQLRAAAACLRRHRGWLMDDGEVHLLKKLFSRWRSPPREQLRFEVRVIAALTAEERHRLLECRRWMIRRLRNVSSSFFRAFVEYAFPAFAAFQPVDGYALLLAIAQNYS